MSRFFFQNFPSPRRRLLSERFGCSKSTFFCGTEGRLCSLSASPWSSPIFCGRWCQRLCWLSVQSHSWPRSWNAGVIDATARMSSRRYQDRPTASGYCSRRATLYIRCRRILEKPEARWVSEVMLYFSSYNHSRTFNTSCKSQSAYTVWRVFFLVGRPRRNGHT